MTNRFSSLRRILLIAVAAASLLFFGMSVSHAAEPETVVTWLSVGAGDSILIEAPGGEKILVDGGLYSKGDTVCGVLKKKEITRLDYVINTHPHEDHCDGLVKVFDEVQVDHFIYNGNCKYVKGADKYVTKYSDILLQTAELEPDCTMSKAKAGQILTFGDMTIRFVQSGKKYKGINKNSLALLITYGKKKVLLTGDTSDGTQQKIKKYNVDVCDLPHHGAANGTTRKFIKRFDPEYVVVSADGKTWGHPSRKSFKTIRKYDKKIRVYRTYKDGNITLHMTKTTVRFDQKGVTVRKAEKQTKNK